MKLRYLLPFAVLALFFIGCEVDESCETSADCGDGQVCEITAGETEGTCVDVGGPACEPACAAGESCVNGTCVASGCDPACTDGQTCVNNVCVDDSTPLEYRFVRIDDLSPMADTEDGGADIDSITLFKGGASGAAHYAANLEYYEHGGGMGDNIDPEDALGAPDSFYAYPDTGLCDADMGFVSLGGTGGTLIVSFDSAATDAHVEQGDFLQVLEVGGCDYGGGTAFEEEVDVLVSVASDPDNIYWVSVGRGEGPEIPITVPALPVIEAE